MFTLRLFRWFREQDDILQELTPVSGGSLTRIGTGTVTGTSAGGHGLQFGAGAAAGPLLLNQVKLEDTGIFVCLVNNSISQETVRIQLNVYGNLFVCCCVLFIFHL